MKKANWGFILIIIILSVLVGGMGGYIIRDKLTKVENDDENVNSILSNDDALMIAKTQIEKYFDFYHALGVYCGEVNIYDELEFGSYENKDYRDYYSSYTFNSVDSVKKYYKSFMVEELYPGYLNDEYSYLEQDGKLYCILSHKGCGDTYNGEDSQYQIKSVTENTMVLDVKLVSGTCGDTQNVRTGTVKLIRGSEGTWLVSEYNAFTGNELPRK